MEAKVYNSQGKESGTVVLPEHVFGLPWNADLVHQVVQTMQANARTPIAHTKDRGDVSGGGKKPWRQKGTGRARHGSTRSPIWVHGGVALGPRNEKIYGGKVNKKARAKALHVVLSEKLRKGELLFVDSFDVKEPKSKEGKKVLENLASLKGFGDLLTKRKNSVFVALGQSNAHAVRSLSNFGNVEVDDVKNLNSLDALVYKTLIIVNPKESVAFIESKLA